MKRNIFFALLLLVAASVQTLMAQKVVLYKTDKTTAEFELSALDSIVFVDEVREVDLAALNVQDDTDDAADVFLLFKDGSYMLCNAKNSEGYGVVYMNSSIDGEFEDGITIFLDEEGTPLMASTSAGVFMFDNIEEDNFDVAFINGDEETSVFRDVALEAEGSPQQSTRKKSIISPYVDAWNTLRVDGHWYWDEHNKKALVPFLCKVASFAITAGDAMWGTGQVSLYYTFVSEFYKSSYYRTDWADAVDAVFGGGLYSLSGVNVGAFIGKGELIVTPSKYSLSTLAMMLNKYGDEELEKLGQYEERVSPLLNPELWKITLAPSLLECDSDDGWYFVDVNSKAMWDIDVSHIASEWCEVVKPSNIQVAVHVRPNNSEQSRICYLLVYSKANIISIPTVALTIRQMGKPKQLCPDDNHPHAIDLGLPSGTKWCCCNVGASTPEGYGGYYAWGETSEKDYYSLKTNKYYKDTGDESGWTKYCTYTYHGYNGFTDGKTELDLSDDVARVRMGAPWRMPTIAQQDELRENCTRQWTQLNGVNGILVTGPNGGSVFLPAAGFRWNDGLYDAGSYGDYWSCSLGAGGSYDLGFDSDGWCWYGYGRPYGLSVRAVRVQN